MIEQTKRANAIEPLSDLTEQQKHEWAGLDVALDPITMVYLWGPIEYGEGDKIVNRPDERTFLRHPIPPKS